MPRTTIMLADDHPIIREGVRALLETDPDFHIVGETGNGLEAVHLAETLRPDVLVLDLQMPGLNGLDVMREVSKRSPDTRVVVLSVLAQETQVMDALRAGALAYVCKDSEVADLIMAVKVVLEGRYYLGSELVERAVQAYVARAHDAPPDPYDTLTDREREVLQLTAESHSGAEIASQLGISPRTVETHRANLMHKLGLRNHTDLVRFALHRGIITLD